MSNCIFCKIIKGEIPSIKIYEDVHVYAFLDISQVTKGHTLIIPKVHVEDIFDMDEITASHLFKIVPKVASAIKQGLGIKGLNIVNNNKEIAGQTVFHSHIHLVPRYDIKDGFQVIFKNNMDDYSKEDLAQIASCITNEVE